MRGIATDLGAAQAMPRVLARAKQDIRWAIFGAWLYQSEKDWKNAVALIEQATSSMDKLTAEEQTRAMQVAGAIYLSSQPPMAEKALATYTALLQRDPEDLATLNNLACLYIDSLTPSDPAKALEFSQRAYDAMRRCGIVELLVMDTHGWALIHNNRVGEGIVLLQEVIQRNPLLDARYHLAEAYLLSDYTGAAESAVRQLTEANAMIADMEARKVPVDPGMKDRIAGAMARAEAMTRQAQPTANP